MEIIKRAPKLSQQWKGTCRSCGSEAIATEGELRNITHDPREGMSFSWEKCPVCDASAVNGYGRMLFYPVSDW